MRDSDSARLIVLLCLLALSGPVRGIGPCADYKTLREDAATCDLLVCGVLKVPARNAQQVSKEVLITEVIKPHPLTADTKLLQLSEELPYKAPHPLPGYLIFCWVDDGKIVGHRAVPAAVPTLRYLKGLLALDPGDRACRLRYCFDYLEHADKDIALDARVELNLCPQRELCRVAQTFSAPKLRTWLSSPRTSRDRLSFYALLLGCCGKDEDAVLLRKLADNFARNDPPAYFGDLLAGYTLLQPKEGHALARKLLQDPNRDFRVRYAALRMAVFFHDTRPDILSRDQALDLARLTLSQPDINDVSIECLRRWRCWQVCAEVLAAPAEAPITRRAILRYTLQCPGPKAAALVAKERASDPERVKDAEELLELEANEQLPPCVP